MIIKKPVSFDGREWERVSDEAKVPSAYYLLLYFLLRIEPLTRPRHLLLSTTYYLCYWS